MPRIGKLGSTPRQTAYARRVWGSNGQSKRLIALDVGYTNNAANSVVSKIESRPGFQNAIAKLAAESNNVAMQIMAEFKSRGVKEFSNKDLVSALNAIGAAWSRFNSGPKDPDATRGAGNNKLRTVILQRVENQTVNTQPLPPQPTTQVPDAREMEDPGF